MEIGCMSPCIMSKLEGGFMPSCAEIISRHEAQVLKHIRLSRFSSKCWH
jgi:hypothetical protein